MSTRLYKVSIDNSEVEKNIEVKKRELEKNLKILDKMNNADVNNEILLASLGLVYIILIIFYYFFSKKYFLMFFLIIYKFNIYEIYFKVIEDTLFVSNLPDNCSERKIKERFAGFGKIKDI